MIVVLSNATQQHKTSYLNDTYEVEDEAEYEEPFMDYYPDEDYKDWKPYPGRTIFGYFF
jgi:hypothetical protein